MWTPTYRMTVLLTEMPIFRVRAACEVQLVSYGSKYALQSLSSMAFERTFTHNLKTTSCILAFCISNDCSTIRDTPCTV